VRYTPKQIEKYRRQKYIAQLEKIGKNLFRMFRNPQISAETFRERLKDLITQLDRQEKIRMESEYLRESERYYRSLYEHISKNEWNDAELNGMREEGMSSLNRLQKIKNRSSYRKEKHRNRPHRDGWE